MKLGGIVRGPIRLVLGNLLVLVALLLVVSVISAAAIDLRNLSISTDRSVPREVDFRKAALPSYDSFERGLELIRDFRGTELSYQPFVGWRRKPYEQGTVTIDAEGYRVHTSTSSTSTPKVVGFFGGSTVWGAGVADMATLPARFDRLGDTHVARNYGETSYNSRQNLALLVNLLAADADLDQVVFYDGVNEVQSLCPESTSAQGHHFEDSFRTKIDKKSDPGSALHRVLVASTIELAKRLLRRAGLLSAAEVPKKNYICDSDPVRAARVADVMISNWRMARDIAAARGVGFIAVLQPHIHVGAPMKAHVVEAGLIDEPLAAQYPPVYEIVKKRIAAIPWAFDLTDAMDGEEFLYLDYCHVNARGNEILAKRVASAIRVEVEPVVTDSAGR